MPVTRSIGKGRMPSAETTPSSSSGTAATTETSATTDSAETSGATATSATETDTTATTDVTQSTATGETTRNVKKSLPPGGPENTESPTEAPHARNLSAAQQDAPNTERGAIQKTCAPQQMKNSKRVGSTKSTSKARKIAKAKEELARLQVELAIARLAAIEADTDNEDEISVYSKTEADIRVDTWLNEQPEPTMLAITNEPHRLPLEDRRYENRRLKEEPINTEDRRMKPSFNTENRRLEEPVITENR